MKKHTIEFRYNDMIKDIINVEEGINDADKITKIILKYNQLKEFQENIESQTRKLSRRVRDLSRMAFTDPNINMHNRNYLEHKLDVLLNEMDNDGPTFSLIIFDVSTAYNSLDSDELRFINKNISTNLSMQSRDIDIVSTLDVSLFALITFTIDEKALKGYSNRCKGIIASTLTDFMDSEGDISDSIYYGFTIARYSDTTASLLDRVVNEAQKEKIKARA